MSLEYSLDQVCYGSKTSRGVYRTLAQSESVTEHELTRIEAHSSLGGSALRGSQPPPILAYYPIDEGDPKSRWVFSKTHFLERPADARGNDYLVRALLLGNEDRLALRGNIFLLSPYLEDKSKPQRDATLDLVPITNELSKVGTPHKLSSKHVPFFKNLVGLLVGTQKASLQVPVDSKDGPEICRTLIELLPPDDRLAFSFCSYFSYTRDLNYRFALFHEADEELVNTYYLRGAAQSLGTIQTVQASKAGPQELAKAWLDHVAKEPAPILGLSFLNQHQVTLTTLQLLEDMRAWAERGAFNAKNPLDDAPEQIKQLALRVGRDLLNRNLPTIAPLFPLSMFETLLEKVTKTLAEEDAYETIAKFARKMHHVFADQEPDWVEMAYRRYGTGITAAHVTTTMTLMLLVAPTPQPDRLFEDGADHICLLYAANRELCFRFLKTWVEAWRDQHFSQTFDFSAWVTLGKTFLQLDRSCGLEAGKLTCRALCVAGPDKERYREKRKKWYKALFAAFHPHLEKIFPDSLLAQVALGEDLFHELSKPSLEQVIAFMLRTPNEVLLASFRVSGYFRKETSCVLITFLKCICTHLSHKNNLYPARTSPSDGCWDLIQTMLGHALVQVAVADNTTFVKKLTESLWLASVNLELDYSKCLEGEKLKANRTRSSGLFNVFCELFEKHQYVEPYLDTIWWQLRPVKAPPEMIEALRTKLHLTKKKPITDQNGVGSWFTDLRVVLLLRSLSTP